MCLDSQTGLQCISEPLVACCHGKDLTAACKCSVPSQKCAVGCCECPLKAKKKREEEKQKQIVILNNINNSFNVFSMNHEICYSTCDSVKSVETVIYSDDVQERDSPIFKPLSRKKKTSHFRIRM